MRSKEKVIFGSIIFIKNYLNYNSRLPPVKSYAWIQFQSAERSFTIYQSYARMHSINLDDSSQILRIALGPLAPAEAKVDTILLESGLWTGALWARELLAEGSAISFRVAPNLVTVGLVLAGFGTGRIAILRTAIARYTGFGVGAAVGIGVVGIGAAADSHTRGVIARGVQGIDARGMALTDRQELALSCLARCKL